MSLLFIGMLIVICVRGFLTNLMKVFFAIYRACSVWKSSQHGEFSVSMTFRAV
ncbi:methylcrotonoyl-CoA carboxylase subunit alpha, mitochondrial isoform X1 [Iris pallida]|uniref:Methylcrotonoyl-CoA carboxylase subunit alpha, mitochondrial isoform X1 n=1 Tax=Iris pallida TaxID=29817 RepID=A0AAX6GZU1_IRIPA|nr:methylcrotonoyl-CoA carboxylase subunit alpha, mitochondrial isoform X1 [Iris pallida]